MSSAQALVPKNMNTNLCNNTYLFSPPTAAALEQYTSFQILYHCIIVSLYHCIFAPSFITNIVISYFSFDKLFLIWQYQEYFTLTCKNTFRGQSRKQACLWLPLDGFLWNSTKCQQHNCELSWNISIYLSIYLLDLTLWTTVLRATTTIDRWRHICLLLKMEVKTDVAPSINRWCRPQNCSSESEIQQMALQFWNGW